MKKRFGLCNATGSSKSHVETEALPSGQDDLTRESYGVLGVPIDVVDMATALRRIESAVARRTSLLISTVNLNFLVTSQFEPEFRASLLLSDFCTADGMPVVWVARILGIPIRERLAGADIFETLKSTKDPARRLKVFLFGGAEGVAAAACKKLNSESGVTCVGSFYPGFTTVDGMSLDTIIDTVNSSKADFLAVALGARKGQAWLLRNHDRLRIPIRVHLGATINFQAGSVQRAPARMQKWGLEWLWRIKEEPQLWRRYWRDGIAFLRLIVTKVMPLIILSQWSRLREGRTGQGLTVERTGDYKTVVLRLTGIAAARNIDQIVSSFEDAVAATKDIVINLANTRLVDARFLGVLCMLHKQLRRRRLRLTFTEVPRRIERILCLSGFEFLLRN
jgi:N-acetylglucosaminyldiphosphoundecaprenol N-acetyl-beta-D-mannosaminyltransferase